MDNALFKQQALSVHDINFSVKQTSQYFTLENILYAL